MTRPISALPGAIGTCIALCAVAPLALPLGAVPITLQSLIVVLAGALAGGGGVAGVIAWLGLAALGLPVLAGMKGGIGAMSGFSAGFLIALPLAARLAMRWEAGGEQPGWRWRPTLLLMLACHGLLLVLGGAVVAMRGGDVAALATLLPGALVKSLVAVAVLWVVVRKRAQST
jgi:biotin transport system substrate-specific component